MPGLKIKLSPRTKAVLVALLAAVAVWLGLDGRHLSGAVDLLESHDPGYYTVARVADGDTIEIFMNGRLERIRFIGVDTPEKNHPEKPVQCFAEAASRHLAETIGNQSVRLEADPTGQNRDIYNRLLRYVFLADGTLLNAKQIEDGYGFAYTVFPFSRMEQFRALENSARQQGLGLWSSCRIEQDGGYINTHPVL